MFKKMAFFLVACLFVLPAIAGTVAVSTGKIGASEWAITGTGQLTSINIRTDGTNAVTVILYDGSSSAGKEIWSQKVNGADNFGGWIWPTPLRFENGVYVSLSGTGGYCYVEYSKY